MHQLIHHYKLRLTNLSQANRSLKLARLSKRRDIDFKAFDYLEGERAEELLARLIAGKDVRLINRLDPRFEPVNLADRRLVNIFREVRIIFEETGTYDLFVGYPFVEGKFIDGTPVRCPLLLIPVGLRRNLQGRPRWKLERIAGESITFNKTFFLAYEQFQQLRLKPAFWEEEIDDHKDWREWLNLLYQKIKDYQIEVNFNPRLFDLKLNRFDDYLQSTLQGFPLGQLKFQPQAVLGIFPQSDSALFQDYEQLEQHTEQFSLGQLFDLEVAPVADEQAVDYVREEHRFFVTPVDSAQEQALLDIKAGKSLVIHGPPGTGKSQVIVNIIADALAHGKKVLLVSQKRAALDVVYKRLHALGLGQFCVLVHDYRHDRNAIYKKVRQQIDALEEYKRDIRDLNLTRWEHEYKLLSRQADQYHRLFESLYQTLTAIQDCGMSVHELYLHTRASDEILPLREVAQQLDISGLNQLLDTLEGITDYADFFAADYPWKDRLSFRHYTHDDKSRLREKLGQLPAELQYLHQQYHHICQQLGEEVIETRLNQKRITAFRLINEKLQHPQIRADLEAIYLEELKPSFIKRKLGQIEKILDDMQQMKLLADFPWSLYSSLHEHIHAYKDQVDKPFRLLSVKYLRGRWFLRKLLKQQGLRLDEDTFNALYREYKLFNRLHHHYVSLHERAFFQDFPLLENLAAKYAWLSRKKEHLEAFLLVDRLLHLKKLRPRFVFGKLDETGWEQSMQQIDALEAFNLRLQDSVRNWRHFLHPSQIEQLKAGIRAPEDCAAWLQQLIHTFERDFSDLQQVDRMLADATTATVKCVQALQAPIASCTQPAQLLEQVRNSIYFYWIEQIESRNPVLLEVSTRGWARKGKDFALKLKARQMKVTELIQRRLKERMVGIIRYNRLKNPVTYRSIYHQVSKKRRLWPVRKLVKESWESGLNELVPCWMASPESVAAIFPMKQDFFDVVVFDEASQCFVERAVPVVLRGKQCVIAGDDKQLQPLNLYTVRYEEAEEEEYGHELALEVESILDLAKNTFSERKLTWHYRSKEEELINFSNHFFYEGKLQVIPAARHRSLYWPPLEWIQVEGKWSKNRNVPEAERVLELILELIQRDDQPSLGVVTFNFYQQELIRDLLDKKSEELARQDEALYQRLQAAMHQTENEEFVGIFVKNIENVQGDERDVIIFSVGYGYNEQGKLHTHFGLLSQKGGENRLNVAISRARQKVYVVCSFHPSALQVEDAANQGPRYFKQYLHYVKAVSEGRREDALALLHTQYQREKQTRSFENPIADYLAGQLSQRGYFCVRNFGDTSYKLDLAVKQEARANDFLLGIECEGLHYFSGQTAKEREVYRPNLLQSRGWQLYRVWARNFWLNPEQEVEHICQLLESAKASSG
ncbi:MAG: DUF4011 domain-containing protein [Bacteroidetes bacterium]|nr:MAG: DUF4011 domain-containing protein [Bacteroidota bacterium]